MPSFCINIQSTSDLSALFTKLSLFIVFPYMLLTKNKSVCYNTSVKIGLKKLFQRPHNLLFFERIVYYGKNCYLW